MTHVCELSRDQIVAKNHELYDDTSSPAWYLAVYGPVHGGWEFINLGGRQVTDRIASDGGIGVDSRVIDLCAGQGAAARYLASRYGCFVDAVEWNANQAATIQQHLKTLPPAVADRIQIHHADATLWQAAEPADIVFSIDSLMLIPHSASLIRNAYRNLRPGGRIFLVVISAGPQVTNQIREFVADVDGMFHLQPASWYMEALEQAGFRQAGQKDLTTLAIRTSIQIDQAVRGNAEAIVHAGGTEAYTGWLNTGAVYLHAFQNKQLAYTFLSAQRPDA